MRALAARGTASSYAAARSFLSNTLYGAELGVYGQAIEVSTATPYKPMDVTLYNCLGGAGFMDTVIRTLFGVAPPLILPGSPPPPPTSALVDASVPRGFEGVLSGVRFGGSLWDVTSDARGLTIAPHANTSLVSVGK